MSGNAALGISGHVGFMVRMRFILPYEPFRATCGTIALIIWPNPRAGKMKPILCSDWLPERGRSAYLARLVFPPLVPQEKVLFINPLLAKLVRSTSTSTSCRSKNTQKKNFANTGRAVLTSRLVSNHFDMYCH